LKVRGLAFSHKGMLAEARSDLEKSLRLDPQDSETREVLEKVRHQMPDVAP
jgi:hypothetical protein